MKRAWTPTGAVAVSLLLVATACGGGSPRFDGSAGASPTASPTGAPGSLDTVPQAVPTAEQSTSPVQFKGSQGVTQMADYLTIVVNNVAQYWNLTLAGAGMQETFVYYNWLKPGESVTTGCTKPDGSREVTDDNSAAYCPPDDTIYVSQQFAFDFWNGLFGGQSAGVALGDFGVAYVIAHEFAHNIQLELGIFSAHRDLPTSAFELQADCLAGTWANSAYYQGLLEAGDVEEALASAATVGDFDFYDPGHHGTPDERQQAWSLGYNSGNPAQCGTYTGG